MLSFCAGVVYMHLHEKCGGASARPRGTPLRPTTSLLANIVTGCSVLAPAGMLSGLSSSLDVTIRDAGLLITFIALAPIVAILTKPRQTAAWPA
jgi:predicted MFS family arabinose efflux permease